MIRTYNCEGIILGRKNIGEADKLVCLFTKEFGKKTVVAHGIRKITSKRAPLLELFFHVRLLIHRGRMFDVITEVSSVHSFTNLRKKLERVGFCYIALEITQRLTAENQEHPVIFYRLLNLISMLNNRMTTRTRAIDELTSFKRFLLTELGFASQKSLLNHSVIDESIERILESRLKSPLLLTNIYRSL